MYKSSSRREFIKETVLGLGLVTLGSFSLFLTNGCSDFGPTESEDDTEENDISILIDISLPENQAVSSVGGAIAIGANALDRKGMLIYRESETSILVISRKCTHNGCVIGAFQNGVSTCPCHGSKYNTSGGVINGPASKPLKQYNASILGNIITITL